ncbi:hypothetical protein CUC43_00470 [Bacillus thuringiensis LM1212]|uniref:hypothetical protein n=1 Tax=Bacillus cereus group TaxID=86661 RepID=UPI000496E436|nr:MULTISPECIES: hypothetical protein [Bacillus cereus group]AXY05502.1 hypothetical protein CUC43_00470 [Bacillus thuringiensis LM1212]QDF23921.1 hypothetical protein FJR70_13180 [Bacillus tropicus]QUG93479.1 hypothetical protein HCM98_20800 [Bacillus tropicus]
MCNVLRRCLACDYQIKTYQAPEDEYQEVTVCPKCKGAFVDVYKINKYIQLNGRTKCNGKPLTERQIDMLQFMINNYYKKNMNICSCDVERVLIKKDKG